MKRQIPRIDETYNPDGWGGDSPELENDPAAEAELDEETTAWDKMFFPI